MQRVRRLIQAARLLPGMVVGGWTREYQDARVILEQNGELRYLQLSARVQRFLVRGSIVTSGALLVMLLILAITSLNLMLSRAKLERSHEAVYRALLSSASDSSEGGENLTLSDEQMVALAQTIRDRDMSIRRFVDTSMVAVAQENVTMKSQLESSGLTEKIVKIIQQNSANGGFIPEDTVNNPLLRGKVADELATNRSLREVLYALPTSMPVENFSVTSDFGIRRHPVSGQTHFHTGLDLLSETGDDKVHPVKPGVVVLAQKHPQYGNMVMVRHTNGVESLYGHLANIDVSVGDKVTANSVLGNIGNTGVSTGKHLHLEILIGGYPVNPLKVIRTAQYVQQIQNQQH